LNVISASRPHYNTAPKELIPTIKNIVCCALPGWPNPVWRWSRKPPFFGKERRLSQRNSLGKPVGLLPYMGSKTALFFKKEKCHRPQKKRVVENPIPGARVFPLSPFHSALQPAIFLNAQTVMFL